MSTSHPAAKPFGANIWQCTYCRMTHLMNDASSYYKPLQNCDLVDFLRTSVSVGTAPIMPSRQAAPASSCGGNLDNRNSCTAACSLNSLSASASFSTRSAALASSQPLLPVQPAIPQQDADNCNSQCYTSQSCCIIH